MIIFNELLYNRTKELDKESRMSLIKIDNLISVVFGFMPEENTLILRMAKTLSTVRLDSPVLEIIEAIEILVSANSGLSVLKSDAVIDDVGT